METNINPFRAAYLQQHPTEGSSTQQTGSTSPRAQGTGNWNFPKDCGIARSVSKPADSTSQGKIESLLQSAGKSSNKLRAQAESILLGKTIDSANNARAQELHQAIMGTLETAHSREEMEGLIGTLGWIGKNAHELKQGGLNLPPNFGYWAGLLEGDEKEACDAAMRLLTRGGYGGSPVARACILGLLYGRFENPQTHTRVVDETAKLSNSDNIKDLYLPDVQKCQAVLGTPTLSQAIKNTGGDESKLEDVLQESRHVGGGKDLFAVAFEKAKQEMPIAPEIEGRILGKNEDTPQAPPPLPSREGRPPLPTRRRVHPTPPPPQPATPSRSGLLAELLARTSGNAQSSRNTNPVYIKGTPKATLEGILAEDVSVKELESKLVSAFKEALANFPKPLNVIHQGILNRRLTMGGRHPQRKLHSKLVGKLINITSENIKHGDDLNAKVQEILEHLLDQLAESKKYRKLTGLQVTGLKDAIKNALDEDVKHANYIDVSSLVAEKAEQHAQAQQPSATSTASTSPQSPVTEEDITIPPPTLEGEEEISSMGLGSDNEGIPDVPSDSDSDDEGVPAVPSDSDSDDDIPEVPDDDTPLPSTTTPRQSATRSPQQSVQTPQTPSRPTFLDQIRNSRRGLKKTETTERSNPTPDATPRGPMVEFYKRMQEQHPSDSDSDSDDEWDSDDDF